MERPKRSAAEKARSLIAAGISSAVIDARNSSCLSPEEEDRLDKKLSRRCDSSGSDDSDYDVPDNTGSSSTSVPAFSYTVEDVEPSVPQFRPLREPGPHFPRKPGSCGTGYSTALDFFSLYFTDEVIENLCENTNTYALVHLFEKPSYSRKSDGAWTKVMPGEMKRFLGIIIMMGINSLPTIARYWSTKRCYKGGWAPGIMSRNRFKALLGFLHISDPATEDVNDKLCKLQPLLAQMNSACGKLLQPARNVAVDERMVKSKARSGLRQYMPKKPTRFGYKIWCVCESGSGYTLDFNIYTGKREHPGQYGLAYDVVMALMPQYFNQGYFVFFDNFYSTMPVINGLHDNGVGVCCTTLQTRRGLPEIMKDKEWKRRSKRGELCWVRQGNVLFLKWKDTKPVFACSTIHKGSDYSMVKRKSKDPNDNYRIIIVRKPQAIATYNQHMGAVDLSDQMIEPYNVLMKCHRWWKTLFFHLIDLAIVNSFILFKKWRALHPNDPRLERPAGFSQLEFREELADHLFCITEELAVPPRTASNEPYPCTVFLTKHLPQHTPRRHNCKVCYVVLGKEKRTQWWCCHPACNVPLCLSSERDCFGLWHSEKFNDWRPTVLAASRHLPR